MKDNIIYIILAFLFLINIIEFIQLIALRNKQKRQKKRYDRLLRGMSPDLDLEEVLLNLNKSISNVDKKISEVEEDFNTNNAKSISAFVKTGVVHYNAYEDQHNELSFSLCLLDKTNTGIVLTSIYGRDFSNVYLKDVKNGEIENASPEEIKSLKIALDE
ncbi:MAG: DUF4446 family protein [Peptoniphilaceae bacterium]|nr:DUF4446 family protein [Peptoniphilaceae bacterium]MDY3738544.1 DUF4446 family protein [Peptoniphilaceae bacterium]